MSKPPLFFIAITGLIITATSFHFMQRRREEVDSDMTPLQQKPVVMNNKREKPVNDRRSHQREMIPVGASIRYEASFKPRNGGTERTFRLDTQQCHASAVGNEGILSYKGTCFVSFIGEQ